jgi:hypothetical protein
MYLESPTLSPVTGQTVLCMSTAPGGTAGCLADVQPTKDIPANKPIATIATPRRFMVAP